MGEQAGLSRKDLEAKLIARAWKDEAFARELRSDPKGVLERELAALRPGAKLPEGVEVTVLEETPSSLYLVIPPKPRAAPTGELSDEQLEAVAGGQCQDTGLYTPDYERGTNHPADCNP